MLKFANRANSAGVSLTSRGKSAQIRINSSLPGPCTIATEGPVRGPGTCVFEVTMPKKGVRTAVGFMETPRQEYMTPDYLRAGYVSYGGAGFIYPAKAMSRASYGEGDTISCQLDFDAGRVTFFVNGQEAGGAPWRGAAEAYPAVSVFPGDLVCDVVLE
ncbi:hypothetical protein CHLRE_01g027500v5 [Chlamydomonas reinhardtii]|uniref:B30.2/SPRY domain-containing protein n=1 Tax=Chlamydomonas reinhardtii TaxID=3055 RepID=A0A2K3E6J7_CHLRE|nr:uncharacterized protein CHLRE_01g027500v5 [Chlamydomonas reinhardtii]PNW88394.1 hypothetical protein CHLRE_01g027500v5 [Chlamydomonas reinhardtii]